MKEQAYEYQDGTNTLEGYLVTHEDGQARPGVMISHTWAGVGDFEKQKAREVAELGYNVLAIDMYGKGKRGSSVEENKKLMAPLVEDRAVLRRRILAGLSAIQGLSNVDKHKVAAMGFCFGGLCVLDLARSGTDVRGVVSLHGVFTPLPDDVPSEMIKAKVLALHGYDDPMATPEQMNALCKELNDAGVDWQVHAYGLTYHAFTNPKANDASAGTVFNPVANRRAWQALENFLEEVFE